MRFVGAWGRRRRRNHQGVCASTLALALRRRDAACSPAATTGRPARASLHHKPFAVLTSLVMRRSPVNSFDSLPGARARQSGR
eukprot:1306221-Prymnesium_polylepis.2